MKASDLNNLLQRIAELTGQATSKEEAKANNLKTFLHLEYASVYGGYRLITVNAENGGHGGAFGGSSCEGRLKAKDMYTKLSGIYQGLIYSKNQHLLFRTFRFLKPKNVFLQHQFL